MRYTIDNLGELEARLAEAGVLEPARVIAEEIRPRLEKGHWVCDGDHGSKVNMILDSWPQKCGKCYDEVNKEWADACNESGANRGGYVDLSKAPPFPPHGLYLGSWTNSRYTMTEEEHEARLKRLEEAGVLTRVPMHFTEVKLK